MSANSRPLAVTIIGSIYIATGLVGFGYHFSEVWANHALYDGVLVELISLLAAISGVFMLLGRNWARWLALAWMALHVVVSAFHSWPEFAMHCLFLAVIAWLLFRPEVTRYFSGKPAN